MLINDREEYRSFELSRKNISRKNIKANSKGFLLALEDKKHKKVSFLTAGRSARMSNLRRFSNSSFHLQKNEEALGGLSTKI